MTEEITNIEEGQIYSGIDTLSFSADLKRKAEGRRVLIERIYKRHGATERSFVCLFLANNTRQKDHQHTFNEYERLARLLRKPCSAD